MEARETFIQKTKKRRSLYQQTSPYVCPESQGGLHSEAAPPKAEGIPSLHGLRVWQIGRGGKRVFLMSELSDLAT